MEGCRANKIVRFGKYKGAGVWKSGVIPNAVLSIEMTGVKDSFLFMMCVTMNRRGYRYCSVVDGVKERVCLCFVMKRGDIPL